MTVRKLKSILNMLDDDSAVKISITDEGLNETTVEVDNYSVYEDDLVLEGECYGGSLYG